jgi:pilus assembly protein TadC
MTVRKKIDERLETVPKELRDPPVAFAAASLLGPLFIVLLALAAGQNDVSSPLYSLAALIFVGAVVGFIVTSFRRLKVRRAEEELWEEERALRRHARRPSASLARSPSASEDVDRADERRAS